MKQIFCLFSFVFLSFLFINEVTGSTSSGCPEDWLSYHGVKCYRLLDEQLRSFDDAQQGCATLDESASLATVHSPEEQAFLQTFVFKTLQSIENVWLGAKYSEVSQAYQWVDSSDLRSFANWLDGKPVKKRANYCAQMSADEYTLGKWSEERCEQRALVLCQRLPILSLAMLYQAMLQTRMKLAGVERQLQNSFPLGFIYVQLPKERSPSELWPTMSWSDVSATYAGVFFRVTGGTAAAWGEVQEGNAPRVKLVSLRKKGELLGPDPNNVTDRDIVIHDKDWSRGINLGGRRKDGSRSLYTQFKVSSGEVCPRNMAIRVWKRTG